jgi:hypothetical protein
MNERRKQHDKTLAKVLFILRDIYMQHFQQYKHAIRARDMSGINSAQSAMLVCEEIAKELSIVLFSEAEKLQMKGDTN